MGHAVVFGGGEASAQEGANIQSCSRLASAVREYWQRLTAKYWTPPPLCSVARSTSLCSSSVSDSRLLFCILVSAADRPTPQTPAALSGGLPVKISRQNGPKQPLVCFCLLITAGIINYTSCMVIDTTCIVCGAGSMKRSSVRSSVPSVNSSSCLQRVCC